MIAALQKRKQSHDKPEDQHALFLFLPAKAPIGVVKQAVAKEYQTREQQNRNRDDTRRHKALRLLLKARIEHEQRNQGHIGILKALAARNQLALIVDHSPFPIPLALQKIGQHAYPKHTAKHPDIIITHFPVLLSKYKRHNVIYTLHL